MKKIQGISILKMKVKVNLVGAESKNTIQIGQFSKLLQRMGQVPRLIHEPLVSYSQS